MAARFIILVLFFSSNAIAQTSRLDSLKRLLSTQSAQQEVNTLNELANAYVFHYIHSDSCTKYAEQARQKSIQLSYNSGKARALITLANMHGRLLRKPMLMQQLCMEAITLSKNAKDQVSLATGYYVLSLAYTLRGKYDSAIIAGEASRDIAKGAGYKTGEGWAYESLGFCYSKHGIYWKSFENLIEAKRIGEEIHDSLLVSMSLAFIARSFNRTGDPSMALSYYHQALQFAPPFLLLWPHHEDMAYAHMQLKQYDSVTYYQQTYRHNLELLTTDRVIRKVFTPSLWGLSLQVQLALKQYDKVLEDILPYLDELRQSKDIIQYMQALLNLGQVYEAKKNYQLSLGYTRELLQLSNRAGSKQFNNDAYALMASLFDKLKQSDSAYYYLKKFSAVKDSLETAKFAQRTALYVAASQAEARIRLLKKDNEITQQQLAINRKELQKKSQLKNWLLGSLACFIILSLLVYRNINLKRKNEKLRNQQIQSSLQRKAADLEMQALRAQMNPHFIFNCLSAIDNLIQTSQADKATSYLSLFANLIRAVLDGSKNNLVSFQRDFETLRLYLELEQFRCNDKFKYALTAESELLNGDYHVPPLIIQPFVENAIHHGLLNKPDNNRQLDISAVLQDEHIIYRITDNGIGRREATIIKERNRPGQKSYGIDITRERINLYNKNGISNDVIISDLEDDGRCIGTKAVVRISSHEL